MNKKPLSTIILVLGMYNPAAFSEPEQRGNYSPYANADFPDNVYWGDTHVHTSLSPDAYTFGTRLTPDDAYRFARGETVTSNSGQPVRLHRPLDFVLVADHGAFLVQMTAKGLPSNPFWKRRVSLRTLHNVPDAKGPPV